MIEKTLIIWLEKMPETVSVTGVVVTLPSRIVTVDTWRTQETLK